MNQPFRIADANVTDDSSRVDTVFYYLAHGIVVGSPIALPYTIIETSPISPDVLVEVLPDSNEDDPPTSNDWGKGHHIGKHSFVFSEEAGTFTIRDGRNIRVKLSKQAVPGQLMQLVAGRCLGVALNQRSTWVMHASCVAYKGHAIAFAGHCGAGKSTLAVALHKRGFSLVSDDVIACEIDETTGRVWVPPGMMQFKLWPDSCRSVGVQHDRLPRIHPNWEKRCCAVNTNTVARPYPLSHIYILSEKEGSSEVQIERLHGAEAFFDVYTFGYPVSYISGLSAQQQQRQFQKLGSLFDKLCISRLTRTASLDDLDSIVETVLADLGSPLATDSLRDPELCGRASLP